MILSYSRPVMTISGICPRAARVCHIEPATSATTGVARGTKSRGDVHPAYTRQRSVDARSIGARLIVALVTQCARRAHSDEQIICCS